MVNVNNNFNVIPWYSSLEQQNHRKWYAFDKQWPLIMPNTRFLPFQFVLETAPASISAITVYSEDKSITRNLGIAPIAVPNAEKGYCVVMLHPEICDFTAALPEGRYYATLTIDGETLYSEVFTVVGNISSYLKLTYWNTDTLYYKNGEINYANDFRYEMYLDTTIGKPEYEFSEELTTRLGYKFLESQISNKLYKFVFLGPEFICDAMRLIRLSDYIKLESGRDSYNAISFSYEPSWETQGDLASIEVSFETDTIIQKLPSFNRNQRENFYNALLSSASEPLLYDEGVVAQYYTAFSDAITGKLTRQLAEANVEEITKSTMIPIDQGLGAAQRVSLLALFERYGGKENAYVSELQTTVSNHISNRDIHLAAGEREKLTTLLSFFRFDKTNNAVVTPFNFISEGTIGMGDLGDGGNTPGATPSIGIQLGDSEPVYPNANGLITLPPYPEVGLDESALEQYLKTNQYAKKSDIPSLAGYATEQWVKQQGYLTQHQDLSAYAKSADVANTYATKTALQTLQNAHNALSTKVTSLDNLLNSDVSGVINTWGEVVNFLDEYSGSQDLATILAGMNNDIANRVLYTDFEKLEGSVSGIAGYFTNGSANNALKLGGQLPSYYATADALNLVKKDVTAVSNRVQKFEDVIGIDANGDVYIKGTRNFYTEGGTIGMAGLGSGGSGDVPSSGGINEAQLWDILGQSGTQIIHSSHIPDLSNNYLSTSGGTIANSDLAFPLLIKGKTSQVGIILKDIEGTNKAAISWESGVGTYIYNYPSGKYISIKDDGTPTYNGSNTLLHSGNIGSQKVERARYIETLDAPGTAWYGDSYRIYGQWASETTLDWKVTGYEVRVDIAKKLDTARTIWGQSFDGTGNVDGNITITPASGYYSRISAATNGMIIQSWQDGVGYLPIKLNPSAGNVLIGTTTDSGYKLAVNGTLNATTIYQNGTAIGSLAFKNSLVASDIPSLNWSKITSGKPTTLGGYGITDAISTSGGIISASGWNKQLSINRDNTSGSVIVGFYLDNTFQGGLGFNAANSPIYSNTNGEPRVILTQDNYSSYALPLSGGTISSGAFSPLTIKGSSSYAGIGFQKTGDSAPSYLVYVNEWDWRITNINWADSKKILHSDNYSSYALPLSGGKMTGTITWGPFTAFGESGGNFYLGSPEYPLKLRSNGTTTINDNTLIHSGNIGSQKVERAKYIETLNYLGNGWYGDSYKLYAQWFDSTICDWKSADNANNEYKVRVDIAKKLDTARTIWGQSFDGTGNVSGGLADVTSILFNTANGIGIYRGSVYSGALTATDIAINGSKIVLNPTGNVLIGTTTDNGGKLQVAGGPVKVLMASSLDDAMFYGERTDLGYRIGIGVGTSANRGIYDIRLGWCFKIDTADNLSILGHTVTGGLSLTAVTGTSATSNKLKFIRNTVSDDYWDYGLYAQSTKGLTFFQSSKGVDTDIAYLTGNGDLVVTGTIAMAKLASSSDRKLKDNITLVSAEQSMSVIRQLKPTTWSWKKDGKKSYGLIAQEVAPIVPAMVVDMGHLHLEYNQLHAFEIGAIKHIDSEVEVLKRRVNELEMELKQYRRNA